MTLLLVSIREKNREKNEIDQYRKGWQVFNNRIIFQRNLQMSMHADDFSFLGPLMEVLEQVKDGQKVAYIEFLLDDLEQNIENARNYAESNNIDFEAALDKVMVIKPFESRFCKNGC